MIKTLRSSRVAVIAVAATLLGAGSVKAQTYTWTGAANSQFYNTSNWTSTDGFIAFDNSSFKVVVTNATGASPQLDQFTDWQPGIYNNLGGSITFNADYNVYYNDWLNGTVTVNTGAFFTCRNIIRVGREGSGTVNLNGGTMRCLHESNWQGIFIGALANGNGTVNVNSGGVISGGYQVEVGTRDFYPTGVLNVNEGGTSEAYWTTVIGPNGTINVNGGTVNCGQVIIVGDLYVDTAGNTGTVGNVVGQMYVNSGTVTVNHLDLGSPAVIMHANSKVVIDNGTFRVRRTGVDFSETLNGFITGGQLQAAEGKTLTVTYDGTEFTTVTATANAAVATVNKKEITLYPNPALDKLNIAGNALGAKAEIKIVSITGETVLNQPVSSINNAVDISRLASGMYIATITSDNSSYTSKFIKK
ncbi:T9SS type A sorting domain-containing protein [Flavobacterium sp. RHBU_3]|uniref:T9SS type A sorting domain-containing protein n=1 Tax=Flavobacterium sp. RHBU_3 TaxID=3391184 RepID=UPI0039856819